MSDWDNQHTDHDIELIDILRTLWKWRWIITGGTVLFALVAGGFSYIFPEIYRVDMVIRPGMVEIDEDGRNVYLDDEQNIKAIISSGTFNDRIIRAVNSQWKTGKALKEIEWETELPYETNTLKISYETHNPDQGRFILDRLYEYLAGYYKPMVQRHQEKIHLEISGLKSGLAKLENEIAAKNNQIKNHVALVTEIEGEIGRITENTQSLTEERSTFLKRADKDTDPLAALVYTNTIQQSIRYLENLKSRKTSLLNEITKEKAAIQDRQSEKAFHTDKIDRLTFQASNIQNVQKLQKPTVSADPVRPQVILNIAIAIFIGLFVMLFAALLGEYIRSAGMNLEKRQNPGES